ncbi:MAG: class I SAM-dependent methyltransferase [Candidatus Goldbacteria bacterium]|nr:class I SAM-dependent methyltransferase [Candidatus Goldiibacteriota bacterium]
MQKQSKAGLYIPIPDPLSDKRQRKYAAMCSGRNVLELGGVKGQFIDLAIEAGAKSVISIDRIPMDKRVKKADIIKFLKSTKKKFGAVYARHMLEHFPPENVAEIIKNVFKCLEPGGIFIIVIPNTNNIAIATSEFWREFEHVRPYSAIGMKQVLERKGFIDVKIKQDEDSWDNSLPKKIIRKIRSIIVGIPYESPDVYITATKPLKK